MVVSDSHLSPRVADTGRNWSAALRYMEAAEPDFVIHVGDLCMDAIHHPQQLAYGRAQMDRVPAPARDRLGKRVRERGVGAVLSGHVHQSRVLRVDGVTHLWAPTTWAVLPDSVQATIGSKRCGLLQIELRDDGPLVHKVVEPAGMAQLVISDGVPDPPR